MEGVVHKGEDIMLYPDEVDLKVRTIQVHGEDKDAGVAGQRPRSTHGRRPRSRRTRQVARRQRLPWSRPNTSRSNSPLPSADFSVKHESQLHVHLRGERASGPHRPPYGARELHPGEKAFARLNFDEPVVAKLFDPPRPAFFSPSPPSAAAVSSIPRPRSSA